ncbi:hypothetical protein Bca52824_092935 [Brassica carinata]|uniref:Uncharacterized protein n=1 Tax=Brassica carinata TaxID=52824 RepID=A0A8X7P3I3_BRACI|nr:hypothetical protein Bca52824_092935 [Brassica carinata]
MAKRRRLNEEAQLEGEVQDEANDEAQEEAEMEADFMAQLGGHEAHEEAEVQMFLLLHHNQLKCSVEAVAWLHCCLVLFGLNV